MKKDSLICFRASKDLHEALAKVAKQDQRSLSSTIEIALANYLKERKVSPVTGQEKRHDPRQTLTVPAVIRQQDTGHIGIGAIQDISLGGVKVLMSHDLTQKMLIDANGSRFDIVFNVPHENKQVTLTCESKRCADSNDGMHVGASFVDGDFQSYKTLQTYLT